MMAALDELEKDEMMKHLMDALNRGQDVGHYGRLVFIMGARHFMSNDELVEWMKKDKDCDETKARALIEQVEQQNYNPPRRERVLEWMQRQGFPICPNPKDPDSCNLYKSLEFPREVYEHIGEYREQKSQAANQEGQG
jgi:DNA primase large subunit